MTRSPAKESNLTQPSQVEAAKLPTVAAPFKRTKSLMPSKAKASPNEEIDSEMPVTFPRAS